MSPPPILSADISDTWLALLRSIASQREGTQLRKHPSRPAIESRDVNTGAWNVQMLPTSAVEFVSTEERNLAWERLWKL